MRSQVDISAIAPVIYGYHENPFEVLGPHRIEDGGRPALAVRAYIPESQQVWLVDPQHGSSQPMRQIHPAGLFEAITSPEVYDKQAGRNYQFRSVNKAGEQTTMHDPYSFDPYLSDYDLHLLGEGRHWDCYRKLGAHERLVNGVKGINFAVWAPNAESVSVVGDFNKWDRRTHAMKKHVPGGIWELFVPDMPLGTLYKYSVKQRGGQVVDKIDPYGFAAEVPPKTANIVSDLDKHNWGDDHWMANREKFNGLNSPISIYEVHLGSWKRSKDGSQWPNYRELAHELVEYCQKMGYTHLELMPVSEHPFTGSWGYQTVGYYAVTSRYGSPQDFQYFVDYCHQNGIGVLIDWVPAHFPKDGHGLDWYDGSSLYEHADPRQGEHPDWGTKIFNYGRNEVSNFLISNALFWLDKYHIDGLRVDAVASMLYLDYSREDGRVDSQRVRRSGESRRDSTSSRNSTSRSICSIPRSAHRLPRNQPPLGGVSRPTYLGGLGFSLKWNMGWMNDTLSYMHHEPIHRQFHHDEMTFSLIYAFTENFVLPFSHDEVVHGKGSMLDQMPGDLWQRFANLRLLYGYQWTHPGKKLQFMGSDIAQWHEWDCEQELQWDLLQWESHQGVQKMVADLNTLYRREPALYEVDFEWTGFEWIDSHNYNDSVLVYLRKAADPEDYLFVACNFTPVVRKNYRLGVPEGGWYDEIFNTDSEFYGGSNVGNFPGVMAEKSESHGRPYSIQLTLPPLGVTVLKPRRK